MQTCIPCILKRGDSSKGPFFLARDLPDDPAIRDQVLLRVTGSPDWSQIDGLGGADYLTSKMVIVSPSARENWDVDSGCLDSPSCGNMLSGIGSFAIEQGLIPASDPGIRRVAIVRTTRRLFEGNDLIPSSIWMGKDESWSIPAVAGFGESLSANTPSRCRDSTLDHGVGAGRPIRKGPKTEEE